MKEITPISEERLAKILAGQAKAATHYQRMAKKASMNPNKTVAEEMLANMVLHLTAHLPLEIHEKSS